MNRFLILAGLGFAAAICPCGPAAAQEPAPPAAAEPATPSSSPEAVPVQQRTDSGVLADPSKRIPLDQYLPENCPEPTRQGEIVVCGRPDEAPEVEPAPVEPGDRLEDTQAERETLSNMGRQTPTSCSNVGAGGASGCSTQEYQQWRRQRELDEAREEVPDPY